MKNVVLKRAVIAALPLMIALLLFMPGNAESKDKAKALKISVSKGELKINKVKFSFPWTYEMFEKALGKSDRIYKGSNDIHTYDEKGIILYQKPGTPTVSDFNIYFNLKENYKFTPQSIFSGEFYIEGVRVDQNLSLEELKKKLPQYNFKESLIGSYKGEYKGVYFYIDYNESQTEIIYISCGKK